MLPLNSPLQRMLSPNSHGRQPVRTSSAVMLSIVESLPRRRSVATRIAPSPVRVVIIDDHPLVRCGVRMFLETDRTIQVIGEASDGEAGVALVRELRPDVVLMDVVMSGLNGIEATTAIRRDVPTTEVIGLSSAMDAKLVGGMIRAGAVGYLPKDTRADLLCRAVHGAAIGQVQLATEAAQILMKEMRSPVLVEPLSAREIEVLEHLVSGKTNKGIANALFIGEKTVKTHMSNIIAKFGVQSRTQAALLAVEMRLVPATRDALAS